MKVYCNNCKKILDESFKFCKYCGSSDIITEYPEGPKPKPQFEIEGDTLRKYNFNKGLWNRAYDEYIKLIGKPQYPIDDSYSKGFYEFMDYINSGNTGPNLEQWKKETSIVFPPQIKKIFANDENHHVFQDGYLYSMSITSTISNTWRMSSYLNIGFLDINLTSNMILRIYDTSIYQLKLNEGIVKLSNTDISSEIRCHVKKMFLPKSLREIKKSCKSFIKGHIEELYMPYNVDEFDLTYFWDYEDLVHPLIETIIYDGSKYRFKSIIKNSFDKINKTTYPYYYYKCGLKDVTVKCTDGKIKFGINYEDPNLYSDNIKGKIIIKE